MEKQRDYSKVIDSIIVLVPETETEFLKQLEWNKIDGMYKPPEETIHWARLTSTIHSFIPSKELNQDTEEWKLKVFSELSTIDLDIIKTSLEWKKK